MGGVGNTRNRVQVTGNRQCECKLELAGFRVVLGCLMVSILHSRAMIPLSLTVDDTQWQKVP